MINMVLGSKFSPGITASDSVLVLSRFFLFSLNSQIVSFLRIVVLVTGDLILGEMEEGWRKKTHDLKELAISSLFHLSTFNCYKIYETTYFHSIKIDIFELLLHSGSQALQKDFPREISFQCKILRELGRCFLREKLDKK